MKFGKIIFGALIIIIAVVGFYFFKNNNTKTPPSNNSNLSPELPAEPAKTVVSNFYYAYDNCMKNPPEAAIGRVGEYCQENTGHSSVNFKKNIDLGGTAKAGADPITCSQDLYEKIDFSEESVEGVIAKVIVKETFGPTTVEIPVTLAIENGQWKVDNIACPKP